jgi:hypothetical protein
MHRALKVTMLDILDRLRSQVEANELKAIAVLTFAEPGFKSSVIAVGDATDEEWSSGLQDLVEAVVIDESVLN